MARRLYWILLPLLLAAAPCRAQGTVRPLNSGVLVGVTCPPTQTNVGAGAVYICSGTGAIYGWSGSAWVSGGGGGITKVLDLGTVTTQQVIDNNYQPVLLYTPPVGQYILWLDYDLPSVVRTDSLFLGVVANPADANYAYADPASLVTFGLYLNASTVFNYTANWPGYSNGSRLYKGALYVALTNGMTILRRWTANTSAPFGFGVRGSDGHQWDNYQTQGGVGTTAGATEPNFAQGHGGYVADAPNAYQYNHVYATDAEIIGNDIHVWKATVGGTSSDAGAQPDFHSQEGSPVSDGPDTLVWDDQGASPTPYVRWWDAGIVPTVGSMHVLAVVSTPVVP